jgi:FkbM family methyltransferase
MTETMISDQEYLKKNNLNLSAEVLERRKFRQALQDLHRAEFMLGQALKFCTKDKEAIDVGASIGLYAAAFAEESELVHCFEAIPFVHDQRLKLLQYRYPNILTYNYAVCEEEGEKEFWLDTKKLGNNSFHNIVDGEKIKVKTTYLDKFNFSNIGFIKIDVEGHELSVLKGARSLIDKERPVLMVEIYPVFNYGPIENTFRYILEEVGNYNCFYNYRAKGLIPIDSVEHGVEVANSDITIHDGDFLFVPGELS